MSIDRNSILQRAELCGWPSVFWGGSRTILGEELWRGEIFSLLEGYLPGIVAQLEAAEEAKRQTAARDLKFAVDDEEREKPYDPSEPSARESEALFEESKHIAERANSVEGKLDRLIAINERIAAALETRK